MRKKNKPSQTIDPTEKRCENNAIKILSSKPSNFRKNSEVISRYMNDVDCYPLLTKEELKELSKFESVIPEFRVRMIEANYRLVLRRVIKSAFVHGISDEDFIMELIQTGNLGLIHAVDKFNPSKGFTFSTYADFWIRKEISEKIHELYFFEKSIVEVDETIPDGGMESDQLAVDWINNRYLRKILMNLSVIDCKIIRLIYLYGGMKKKVEYELDLRYSLVKEMAVEILRKVRVQNCG